MNTTPKEVANAYYAAIQKGLTPDKELLASAVSFSGPTLKTQSRDQLLAAMGEHKVKIDTIRRQWVDGQDVCTFYDCALPFGKVPMFEWLHVQDGRIAAIELVFDPRPPSAV